MIARSRTFRIGATLSLATALIAVTSRLWAHDFWLVPGAFPFAEGATLEVRGQTSTRFPTSESPVALARIARAFSVGPDGETPITDLTHQGTSLLVRHRPTSAGQRIVAVDLQARSARQPAAGLLRYLRLEGGADAADRIEREGLLRGVDSVTRTDTKYAKTLVEVGERGPRVFARSGGQVLEFIPEQDPKELRGGDTLRLHLMFRGRLLPEFSGMAGRAPTDSAARAEPDVHLVAQDGVLRLPIALTGLWNIRTIYVVRLGPDAWETHWATFVFRAGR